MSDTQLKIRVPGNDLMVGLLGERDELLRLVERRIRRDHDPRPWQRDHHRRPGRAPVGRIFDELVAQLERGHHLDAAARRPHDRDGPGRRSAPQRSLTPRCVRGANGKAVRPKTAGQRRYVDAIAKNTITFGIGPAGTGKSYLAVALAVQALQSKQVNRIILARPAVEAGERLGFLPGDLMAKVDPYLRPLYDALYDMLEARRHPASPRTGHDRGRAPRLHAWANAQLELCDPRRGTEHHA